MKTEKFYHSKYVVLLLTLLFAIPLSAQNNTTVSLFTEFLPDNYSLKERTARFYTQYKNNPNVSNVYLVKVNSELLNASEIKLDLKLGTTTASKLVSKERQSEDFSQFGILDDGSGIFFTVMNGKVGSKFYFDDYAYTLLPTKEDVHLLIEYHSIDIGHCGNELMPDIHKKIDNHVNEQKMMMDDDCNLRLLIAFTADAEGQIITTLDQFAQIAVDENNLAYMTSGVNFESEIAATLRTTYNEVDGDGFVTDILALQGGTGGLNPVLNLREVYNSDIQVLIRRHENNIWGVAFTNSDAIPSNENNGFCIVSVTGVTDGRFSFAHEIGHLLGANHENFAGNPNTARAFVSPGTTNAWRTIVARTNASPCNLATSCRIQQFSNPNVNAPAGVPSGTATRNNVQTMNDNRNDVLGYRMTDDDLTVDTETIGNEMVSNHLANETITTINNVIAANNSIVTLRAGTRITLNPGFHAQNGTTLRAYTLNDPCEELPESRLAIINDERSDESLEKFTAEDEDKLQQNTTLKIFPNPFSDYATLEFDIQEPGNVSINVFDAQQRLIKVVLDNTNMEQGRYQEELDLSEVTNGVYFVKLQVNDLIEFQKVSLIR